MTLLGSLAAIVGDGHVITDPWLKAAYEVDWTGRFRGDAVAVVRPGSTEETARLVTAARAAGVGLVPQGGNTGLVGSATPPNGSIVVSMERLTAIGEVDAGDGTVRAGAGVTLEALDSALGPDLFWPITHAGASRATVGGSIATNAGGTFAWRYGTVRHHMRGVEAVLGDGTVVSRSGGFLKDNAGLDLSALLCGSEGTLGIVTSATLTLSKRPGPMSVALVGIGRGDRLAGVAAAVRLLPGLLAAEVVFADAMRNACDRLGLRPPFEGEYGSYLVIGFEGDVDPIGSLARERDALFDDRVWAYRERQNEAVAAAGTPVKLDVSLRSAAFEAFEADVVGAAAASDCRALVFGHLLDGNLHVNLVGDGAEALQDEVVGLVARHGGSIAAEHGIGRAKTAWLTQARSAEEIRAMRAIKSALDPDGIMNPGAIFG